MRIRFFVVLIPLVALGCTSLPFAPESGPGTAITLVTLDHIEERDQALRRSFDELVASEVETAVRAAREEDRVRLEAFADRLEAHGRDLASLSTRVEMNAETSLELARVVDERLEALAAQATALAEQARALEAEIGGLPVETLDRLRRVLAAHLETTAASAARAPGEQGSPGSASSGSGT